MSDRSPTQRDGLLSDQEVETLCLRNLLGAKPERLFFKDLQSRFLLVSDGWLEAIGHGLSLEEVIGKTDFDFFTRPHATAAFEDEQRIIRTGECILAKIERETFADRADAWVSTSKWPLRGGEGEIIGTFGVSRNVTAQMQDPATGLANRMAFIDRLKQALMALERQPGRIALFFLDVDGFKQINDTWGHRVGDQVLEQIAHRLTGVSRRFDTVARYGGDEFVVLCTALRENENLKLIGQRVMRAVSAPMDGPQPLSVTSSIGAVVCTDPLTDPEDLLDQGDTAMYHAKRGGGSRLALYDADVHHPLGEVTAQPSARTASRRPS